ncbi:MAG: ABC transporter ATP-binding protein [Lachnospiraceae bacterium]|nr:ABC transporter ATP-binding protein [Lachnospiraceae bacterium]
MNILVKAEHISKDYQLGEVTVHALKDVSFEIYEKELIVVLGPSGSGKSTTLNILGGIETATTGNVYYAGIPLDWRDPAVLTAYRRDHIGFIFQFYNLLPGLTALENIALSAELSKSPLDPSRLIEEVGLGDRRDHFPNCLSGGEQQRIAIARALCKNPDLLLCDEPTGALDSATGIQVLKLIEQFCREYEKTVILITHNQDISKIADRVFHFRDGRIERIMDNPHPIKPEDLHW